MNLQYISDSTGKPAGIFIPFKDWEKLIEKFEGLEELTNVGDIPEWHKEIVKLRIKKYKNKQDELIDWDEIEKKLDTKYK